MNVKLVEELRGYSKNDFDRWTGIPRDFEIIDKRLPLHVRQMLMEKVGNRKRNPQTSRFFSELNILNHYSDMIKGDIVWYSSYKWLTKARWLNGCVEVGVKRQFFTYIMKYIGRDNIANLQERALEFRKHDGGKILGFTKGGKVRYPVAPDIWFILKNGRLKFVEGKHKEEIEGTQLAGLAIIKKYLNCDIEIMRIYPKYEPQPIALDYSSLFSEIYQKV